MNSNRRKKSLQREKSREGKRGPDQVYKMMELSCKTRLTGHPNSLWNALNDNKHIDLEGVTEGRHRLDLPFS